VRHTTEVSILITLQKNKLSVKHDHVSNVMSSTLIKKWWCILFWQKKTSGRMYVTWQWITASSMTEDYMFLSPYKSDITALSKVLLHDSSTHKLTDSSSCWI